MAKYFNAESLFIIVLTLSWYDLNNVERGVKCQIIIIIYGEIRKILHILIWSYGNSVVGTHYSCIRNVTVIEKWLLLRGDCLWRFHCILPIYDKWILLPELFGPVHFLFKGVQFLLLPGFIKRFVNNANSIDPDQTLHS